MKDEITAIVSPAVGGIVPGYEMGRQLGLPAMYVERVDGEFQLRRNFTLKKGQKVLMVEDIVSTGVSSRECIDAIKKTGGKVVAACCLIDRSGGKAKVGVPLIALAEWKAVPGLTPPWHSRSKTNWSSRFRRGRCSISKKNSVYESGDLADYEALQRSRLNVAAKPGVAFALIRKLLALNAGAQHVEVVILSRSDPISGLRAFSSCREHGLPRQNVVRAAFHHAADVEIVRIEKRRDRDAEHVLRVELFRQRAREELAMSVKAAAASDWSPLPSKGRGLGLFALFWTPTLSAETRSAG